MFHRNNTLLKTKCAIMFAVKKGIFKSSTFKKRKIIVCVYIYTYVYIQAHTHIYMYPHVIDTI